MGIKYPILPQPWMKICGGHRDTWLSDDLSFMNIEFQETINETNTKREVANNVIMDRLTTMQAKSNTTLTELSSFMKGTFTVQDKVIQSLQEG